MRGRALRSPRVAILMTLATIAPLALTLLRPTPRTGWWFQRPETTLLLDSVYIANPLCDHAMILIHGCEERN